MNTPIINPMWIWALDVTNDVDLMACIFATILGVAILIALIIYGMWYIDNFIDYSPSEDDTTANKIYIKWFKVTTGLFIGLLFTGLVIPSQKTMYAMIGATYVTEENINIAGETVTDAIDYIFEKVDMLLEEEE